MQNKGLVKLFAFLFGLVSIYQLSFTFKGNQIEKNAEQFAINKIADSDVDYDKDFKIYFTTKLPNPHYLPEVCIKVTIINFTVTFDGLEAQLLGDVVRKERPDVEERKNNLVSSIANDKKQLDELEKKILN